MFTLMGYESDGSMDVNFKIPERIGKFVAVMFTTKTEGGIGF